MQSKSKHDILVVASTKFEIEPFTEYLLTNWERVSEDIFKKALTTIRILVTGVGSVCTAFHLGNIKETDIPDLAINAGVAGSFDRSIKIGDVCLIESDRFGDLGAEEANGNFLDVYELNLADPGSKPFKGGEIIHLNPIPFFNFLRKVRGITVNKVHGTANSIRQIQTKYYPELESMEGAAFFFACQLKDIPCVQIRSISNYVEPRNRENWDLETAIQNLNQVLIQFAGSLTSSGDWN